MSGTEPGPHWPTRIYWIPVFTATPGHPGILLGNKFHPVMAAVQQLSFVPHHTEAEGLWGWCPNHENAPRSF